jgi:hypothetical protein
MVTSALQLLKNTVGEDTYPLAFLVLVLVLNGMVLVLNEMVLVLEGINRTQSFRVRVRLRVPRC